MKKIFIVHGFEGSPNGGWRPWLMAELEKLDIYACALGMPNSEHPMCDEWVEEITRHVARNPQDEIYLIGHSLGVPAILQFLNTAPAQENIAGILLVSGPCAPRRHHDLASFFEPPFDFKNIRAHVKKVAIIHGDDDTIVPFSDAEFFASKLDAELITIPRGGHLNGGSGWFKLPEVLSCLTKMFAQ